MPQVVKDRPAKKPWAKKAVKEGESQKQNDRLGWATEEQTEWLQSHLDTHCEAQAKAKALGKRLEVFHMYWIPLWQDWFTRWPLLSTTAISDQPEDRGAPQANLGLPGNSDNTSRETSVDSAAGVASDINEGDTKDPKSMASIKLVSRIY